MSCPPSCLARFAGLRVHAGELFTYIARHLHKITNAPLVVELDGNAYAVVDVYIDRSPDRVVLRAEAAP